MTECGDIMHNLEMWRMRFFRGGGRSHIPKNVGMMWAGRLGGGRYDIPKNVGMMWEVAGVWRAFWQGTLCIMS